MAEPGNPSQPQSENRASRGVDVWMWRWYGAALLVFLVASVVAALDGRLRPIYWLLLILAALPLLVLVRSLVAFPGRYSLAGRAAHEQARRGVVLLESNGKGGSIGGVKFDRVDWRLHQYGLEVRVPGAGWGFIPAVSMRSAHKVPGGGLRIEHWASELRSPIQLDGSSDLTRMVELWIENRPEDEDPRA